MNLPKSIQPFAKAIAIMLVVLLNGVGVLGVGDTVGFYFDTESSSENDFIAGNVDFTATSTEWNPLHVAVSMQPGDTTIQELTLDPQTSNPFQFFTETVTNGDTAFCDGIEATLEQDTTTLYSGALSGLLTGTTTSTSTLSLAATTGINNFQNSICDLTLAFEGWQTRHGYPTTGGFYDTEEVSTKLASWGFRINKVYADVDPERYADGTSTESENEWVEIYNQTNVDLDISGWEICDNTSCDTIPAGTPSIPQMGYGVIVNSPDVFSATGTPPWYLPAGVVEIVLNDNIGNGLSNAADMLVLKRPDGVIIDQMNWGTPDNGWTNYNAGVWDPAVPAAAEGNLLARVPSGFDTDSPGDWSEIVPPSVDLIYPDEAGSYTWYWGYSYTITWTATNPNGSDSDLNISLFYIKDLDHSGSITDPDTTHTIALTTANDGAYDWTVPSGFLGYIWVKLVATGPENPLNNSSTVSGMIWDPSPIFVGPEGVDPENADTEAPVITLFGNNPAMVPLGADYTDLGASVTDNVNHNLGYTTEGEVDTAIAGEYTITYTATDQTGNVGTATRVVVVYDPALGIPEPEPEVVAPDPEPVEEVTEEIVEEVTEEASTPVSGGGGGTTPTDETGQREDAIEEETSIEEENTEEESATEEETVEEASETNEEETEETEETTEVVEEEETIEETTEEEAAIEEDEEEEVAEEESNEENVEEQIEEEVVPFREEDDPVRTDDSTESTSNGAGTDGSEAPLEAGTGSSVGSNGEEQVIEEMENEEVLPVVEEDLTTGQAEESGDEDDANDEVEHE